MRNIVYFCKTNSLLDFFSIVYLKFTFLYRWIMSFNSVQPYSITREVSLIGILIELKNKLTLIRHDLEMKIKWKLKFIQ